MSTYYTVFLLDDEDIAFGHGSAFWKYFVTALMTKRGERWYNPDDAYTMRSIRVTQEDRDVLKELEKDGFYEATFILSILGGVDGSLVITRHPE